MRERGRPSGKCRPIVREAVGETTVPRPLNGSSRREEVARLLTLGLTQKEVAEITGYSRGGVYNVKERPDVQDKMLELMSKRDLSAIDVRKSIDMLAPLAVQRLRETLESEDAPLTEVNRTARDLLDRAGHGAVRKLEVGKRLSTDDLMEIKAKAVDEALDMNLTYDNDSGDEPEIEDQSQQPATSEQETQYEQETLWHL